MSRHWPRLGLLLGALLLVSLALPAGPAQATTITVDGDPSDWPVGALVVDDTVNEDLYIPGMDIDNVFFTNNPTTLFGRVDTFPTPRATTAWDLGPTMNICFDTIANSGAPSDGARCRFAGMDFRLAIDGLGAGQVSIQLYRCVLNTLCNTFIGGATINAESANNVTEFSVALSQVGITAPGGTYRAYILFDNNDTPPDDFVLDGPARFDLPVPGPTPIIINSFGAARADSGVRLSWTTSSEIGVQGFHVLRSATGRREDATQVTQALIAAAGSGATGASYSFTDATAAPDAAYSYWLQTVSSAGGTEDYGPISYRPGLAAGTKIYLPAVRR